MGKPLKKTDELDFTWQALGVDKIMDSVREASMLRSVIRDSIRYSASELLKRSPGIYGNTPRRKPSKSLSEFEELAGRSFCEAQGGKSGRRISDAKLTPIVEQLDRHPFPLKKHLQKRDRDLLDDWNRSNPKDRIQTFQSAIEKSFLKVPRYPQTNPPKFSEFHPRQAALRALYRAAEKWRKAHPGR
jgi:hypothetical protein